MRTPSALALLGLLAACPEQAQETPDRRPVTLPGCIEAVEGQVSFGAVDLAAALREGREPVVERVVRVRNACPGSLEIKHVRIAGEAGRDVFRANAVDAVVLPQDEVASVPVTFRAPSAGIHQDALLFETNDPARPELRVELRGSVLAPSIQVEPLQVDLGRDWIGCEQNTPLTVRNISTSELVVEAPRMFTAAPASFSLDPDPLSNGQPPFSIPASGSITFLLDYLPLDTLADEALVTLASNDPLQPEVAITARGNGEVFASQTDWFQVPDSKQVDVLFTLDRSLTMTDNRDAVLANLDDFAEALRRVDTDYHIAVVVGDGGCVAGREPHIDPTFSATDAKAAFREMADQERILKPYGANEERGFTIAQEALSAENTGSGWCNADFYRDGAALSLVHISDSAEQSLYSWSYYVGLFQVMKADPADVTIHAVTGLYPSTECDSATPGTGYYEATVATGGQFLSICSPDWGRKLEDAARDSRDVSNRFELSLQPVPQTLEVLIDGEPVRSGWEYDISSNSLHFDPPQRVGARIEVRYAPLPNCER